MNSFMALVKVNFWALLNMLGGGSRKRNKSSRSGTGMLVLLAFLGLYVSGIYSNLFAKMLSPVGMLSMLPALMAVITCMFSLMMTAFGASGIIFNGKDMDFMLSLPISAFSIMLSKVSALYLENLVICFFMMLPCGVVYVISGNAGWTLLVGLIILTFFLAIIPTLFAMVIGLFLGWLQSRLGKNALFSNFIYLIFLCLIMFFTFRINVMISNNMMAVTSLNHVFGTFLYPIGLYRDALLGNLVSFLLFMMITTIPFVVIVYLFSRGYKSILSRMTSRTNRSDYKMQALKVNGQFGSLLKKELGRFWGTPTYLFNTGFGVILAIAGSIYACIQKSHIDAFLAQLYGINPYIIICLIALFLFFMTDTACVSISLEGKTMWILKEAPISAKSILLAKAGLNMLLILGTSILCIPMLVYAFGFNISETLALALLCISCVLFVPAFGLFLNLSFPTMDGLNDTLIVKQSKSSMIAILGGMAIVGLGAATYASLRPFLTDLQYVLIFSGILGLTGIGLLAEIFRKGEEYLLRL